MNGKAARNIVILIVAGIAFLELGLSTKIGDIWALAFSGSLGTETSAPKPTDTGSGTEQKAPEPVDTNTSPAGGNTSQSVAAHLETLADNTST